MATITQLPESDIPFGTRVDRIYDFITAGCSGEELIADIEVALSVAPSPEHAAQARSIRDMVTS